MKKIRIKIESFNSKLLNISCLQILEKIKLSKAKIIGPIFFPTKKRIYCVLRSPHVNKDSREHFEIRIFKRMFDIYPGTVNTIKELITLTLSAGVTFKIY